MQPMSHGPAVAGIGEEVVTAGTEGLAAAAAAAPAVTGLAPAGADEVSAQAATAFVAEAAKTLAVHAAAQVELARAGAKLTEISGIYAAIDETSAEILK